MDRRHSDCADQTAMAASFTAVLAFSTTRLHAQANFVSSNDDVAASLGGNTEQQVLAAYGKLPLSFEANQGQTDPQVKFLSRGRGYMLFLTPTEAVLTLRKSIERPQGLDKRGTVRTAAAAEDSQAIENTVIRLRLVGANSEPKVTGLEQLPGKSNYLIGNDPKKWRTNVPHYARVKYQEVYPGIDLVYYGTTQRQLEYDFVVTPGANPKAIRFAVEGAKQISVDAHGNLVVETGSGEVRFHKPVVYQPVAALSDRRPGTALTDRCYNKEVTSKHFLEGGYVLKDKGQVAFEVAGYDVRKTLIIDPVLSYSTYLGGSEQDIALGIAVDASGNAYVVGTTFSTDFPTASPFQPAHGGSGEVPFDAFVTKLNAAGNALVYSTYLGGSGRDDGLDIAVDSSGNAYLWGATDSSDFPTASPFQPANAGGFHAFVTKLNAAGSALVYSTYLGGSGTDGGVFAIAVDTSRNAYVTGLTTSTDFPTVNPFQPAFAGGSASPGGSGSDAFVTKLNAAGSALVYSTYLGGSGHDVAFGIAVDTSGNAYLTGFTNSSDFPTASPFQAANAGGDDAFVTKLNAAGSALVYSTYLGGSGRDFGFDIAVDTSGNAYLTGFTDSSDFPTASPFQAANAGDFDAFVAKISEFGPPGGVPAPPGAGPPPGTPIPPVAGPPPGKGPPPGAGPP